jgi:hypothetical protein
MIKLLFKTAAEAILHIEINLRTREWTAKYEGRQQAEGIFNKLTGNIEYKNLSGYCAMCKHELGAYLCGAFDILCNYNKI